MKPAFDQLFLLGLLSASIHWIVARSEIYKPVWSRARGWLDKLLRCPSCSGFWIGAGVTWGGVQPLIGVTRWKEIVVGGLCGVFLTPVFEAVLIWGLERSAVADDDTSAHTGEIASGNPALTESGEVTPNERPRR